MDDGIVAAIILGVCFWGVVVILKSIFDYRIIRKMVDKSHSEFKLNDLKFPVQQERFQMLKWGVVIMTGGLGLILIYYMDLNSDSPLPYGIESVFIALGFFLYFSVEKLIEDISKK